MGARVLYNALRSKPPAFSLLHHHHSTSTFDRLLARDTNTNSSTSTMGRVTRANKYPSPSLEDEGNSKQKQKPKPKAKKNSTQSGGVKKKKPSAKKPSKNTRAVKCTVNPRAEDEAQRDDEAIEEGEHDNSNNANNAATNNHNNPRFGAYYVATANPAPPRGRHRSESASTIANTDNSPDNSQLQRHLTESASTIANTDNSPDNSQLRRHRTESASPRPRPQDDDSGPALRPGVVDRAIPLSEQHLADYPLVSTAGIHMSPGTRKRRREEAEEEERKGEADEAWLREEVRRQQEEEDEFAEEEEEEQEKEEEEEEEEEEEKQTNNPAAPPPGNPPPPPRRTMPRRSPHQLPNYPLVNTNWAAWDVQRQERERRERREQGEQRGQRNVLRRRQLQERLRERAEQQRLREQTEQQRLREEQELAERQRLREEQEQAEQQRLRERAERQRLREEQEQAEQAERAERQRLREQQEQEESADQALQHVLQEQRMLDRQRAERQRLRDREESAEQALQYVLREEQRLLDLDQQRLRQQAGQRVLRQQAGQKAQFYSKLERERQQQKQQEAADWARVRKEQDRESSPTRRIQLALEQQLEHNRRRAAYMARLEREDYHNADAEDADAISAQFRLRAYTGEQARDTRVVLHPTLPALLAEFVSHKRVYGSLKERAHYGQARWQRWEELVPQLVQKRAVAYSEQDGATMTRDVELMEPSVAKAEWAVLGRKGEKKRNTLRLGSYLSYDEQFLSALLVVSGPVTLVGTGSGACEHDAIALQMCAPRLELPAEMDYAVMADRQAVNVSDGMHPDLRYKAREWLGVAQPPLVAAAAGGGGAANPATTPRAMAYIARQRLLFETVLLEASTRARTAGKRAWLRLTDPPAPVPLPTEESLERNVEPRSSSEYAEFYMEALTRALRNLVRLPHVAVLELTHFLKPTERRVSELRTAAAEHAVRLVFSCRAVGARLLRRREDRGESESEDGEEQQQERPRKKQRRTKSAEKEKEKEKEDNDDEALRKYLLVVTYTNNGNSLPGGLPYWAPPTGSQPKHPLTAAQSAALALAHNSNLARVHNPLYNNAFSTRITVLHTPSLPPPPLITRPIAVPPPHPSLTTHHWLARLHTHPALFPLLPQRAHPFALPQPPYLRPPYPVPHLAAQDALQNYMHAPPADLVRHSAVLHEHRPALDQRHRRTLFVAALGAGAGVVPVTADAAAAAAATGQAPPQPLPAVLSGAAASVLVTEAMRAHLGAAATTSGRPWAGWDNVPIITDAAGSVNAGTHAYPAADANPASWRVYRNAALTLTHTSHASDVATVPGAVLIAVSTAKVTRRVDPATAAAVEDLWKRGGGVERVRREAEDERRAAAADGRAPERQSQSGAARGETRTVHEEVSLRVMLWAGEARTQGLWGSGVWVRAWEEEVPGAREARAKERVEGARVVLAANGPGADGGGAAAAAGAGLGLGLGLAAAARRGGGAAGAAGAAVGPVPAEERLRRLRQKQPTPPPGKQPSLPDTVVGPSRSRSLSQRAEAALSRGQRQAQHQHQHQHQPQPQAQAQAQAQAEAQAEARAEAHAQGRVDYLVTASNRLLALNTAANYWDLFAGEMVNAAGPENYMTDAAGVVMKWYEGRKAWGVVEGGRVVVWEGGEEVGGGVAYEGEEGFGGGVEGREGQIEGGWGQGGKASAEWVQGGGVNRGESYDVAE
ncbi:uncharacterized protein K452DRAFT_344811 [Aplosporella prunicola CBS 121167]|uniref:Uncharacterized protein n=1 Tax=Aplosporella prunicola CBS 121167 TaxID=1176127 RepID=A0A6A6BM66_9PEZI|nr:uncharacterized protein K452DRAFT_344811 [Aplosporella prunicola CBS 121167]KAF2144768.1 hypothetical protein K452DRAFT_344811 [Aplosporella prunicola CBS 121167]